MNDNVVSMEELRSAYQEKLEPGEYSHQCPGFGERLHILLDHVHGLKLPDRSRGRPAFLAKLTQKSRATVTVWFSKDQLPQGDTLVSLIRLFMDYLPVDVSEVRMESWLRYGDEATPNPFEGCSNPNDEALRLPAVQLVAKTAKERHIKLATFDMEAVIKDTLQMLRDLGVGPNDDMQAPLMELVSQYITQHTR